MKPIKPGYIRVSEILSIVPSIISEKPTTFGYPLHNIDQTVLSNKADIGSSVHAAIDHQAKGDFFPLKESEQGYYNSYLQWAKFVELKPIETELRLYEEGMKITGGIDMLAILKGSPKWRLIDFKCTVSEDAKKWSLQAALYSMIIAQNDMGIMLDALFVKLDKNGEMPEVYEYKITNELQVAALSFYNAYKYVTGK